MVWELRSGGSGGGGRGDVSASATSGADDVGLSMPALPEAIENSERHDVEG